MHQTRCLKCSNIYKISYNLLILLQDYKKAEGFLLINSLKVLKDSQKSIRNFRDTRPLSEKVKNLWVEVEGILVHKIIEKLPQLWYSLCILTIIAIFVAYSNDFTILFIIYLLSALPMMLLLLNLLKLVPRTLSDIYLVDGHRIKNAMVLEENVDKQSIYVLTKKGSMRVFYASIKSIEQKTIRRDRNKILSSH